MAGAESAPQAQIAEGRVGKDSRGWLALITVLCLAVFCVDAYLVATRPLLPFDLPVALRVQGISWPPLVVAMETTNAIAGWWQVLFGGAAVLGFFVIDRRTGWLMAIGALSSLFDNILKVSFERGRPTANLVQILTPASGYSFPSGHAVFYSWLAFMAAFGLAPRLRPMARTVTWVAAGTLIAIACMGRVWAGDHWPSDVLGGLLLGLGWSAFVLWVPERWLPNPRAPKRWGLRKRVV